MLAVESGELATRSAKSRRVSRIAKPIEAYDFASEETSERLIDCAMAFWHTNGLHPALGVANVVDDDVSDETTNRGATR